MNTIEPTRLIISDAVDKVNPRSVGNKLQYDAVVTILKDYTQHRDYVRMT